MISVNNVTVAFGGWELFKDITFIVGESDRIGLVGRNGAGKSTLMKLITKENSPSSGRITIASDCTVGYLAQQMNIIDDVTLVEEAQKAFKEVEEIKEEILLVTEQLTIRTDYQTESYSNLVDRLQQLNDSYYFLDGDNCAASIEKTLIGLGFERSDFSRATKEFSGGWRMRIELAKILLRRPSVILLDEPTNHLDIESIEWLEAYLKDYKGSVVLISHDRLFLDTVTNRTVEIVLGKVYDYRVPYSKYLILRSERVQQQKAAYDNQQKLIKDTEDFVERFRYKASKSNQVQSRIKQLDKLDIVEIDDEDFSRLNMKFPPAPRSGDIVVEGKGVGKSFGEKHIFSGFDLFVERGEKIALVGRNGEGKTTFARMLVNDTEVTRGELRLGHNVKVGYFAQNQDDLMDGDFTVFDTLDRIAVGDIRTRLRDILGAFLFKGEDVDKKVKVLSGGERSRLAMAKLMLEPHNLLILDEPTNHMDIRSKDILKAALKEFDGTLIVISHDREFLDGLIDKVYEFRHGVVKEHIGGIYDFLRFHKMQMLDEMNIKVKVVKEQKTIDSSQQIDVKLSYAEQKEREKVLKKIKSDIKKIEDNMTEIEGKISFMDMQLSSPDSYNIDVSSSVFFDEYNELKSELSNKEDRWADLELQLEEELKKLNS